jgi:hypothetical protein
VRRDRLAEYTKNRQRANSEFQLHAGEFARDDGRLMTNVDFIVVCGPWSLGELVHAIDHAAPAPSDEVTTVDLCGDVFADIRFDAEDDWPYTLIVGSRSGDETPAREHALRVSRLMESRGWDYEHTSGSEECAFCMGRDAAYEGNREDRNPFTKTAEPGSEGWYDSDYGLWLTGYQFGLSGAAPHGRHGAVTPAVDVSTTRLT